MFITCTDVETTTSDTVYGGATSDVEMYKTSEPTWTPNVREIPWIGLKKSSNNMTSANDFFWLAILEGNNPVNFVGWTDTVTGYSNKLIVVLINSKFYNFN